MFLQIILLSLLNNRLVVCQEFQSGYESLCPCDLTINSCDINCCCDVYCSPDDRKVFTECINYERSYNSKSCIPPSTIIFNSTDYPTDFREDLLCIYYDNYIERNFYIQPSLVDSLDMFDEYMSTYAEESFENEPFLANDLTSNTPSYRAGQLIYAVDAENLLNYFVIPQPVMTDYCNYNTPAGFLRPFDIACSQSTRNLSTECASAWHMNGNNYQNFHLLRSPSPLASATLISANASSTQPQDTSSKLVIEENYKVAIGTSSAALIHQLESTTFTSASGNDNTTSQETPKPETVQSPPPPPNPSWDARTQTCNNVAVQVNYLILLGNDGNIAGVSADIVVGSITIKDSAFSRRYSINYKWSAAGCNFYINRLHDEHCETCEPPDSDGGKISVPFEWRHTPWDEVEMKKHFLLDPHCYHYGNWVVPDEVELKKLGEVDSECHHVGREPLTKQEQERAAEITAKAHEIMEERKKAARCELTNVPHIKRTNKIEVLADEADSSQTMLSSHRKLSSSSSTESVSPVRPKSFMNDSSDTFRRSGNPGYLIGLPVMAGQLMQENNSEIILLIKNHSQWLTFMTPNVQGSCTNQNRIPVLFGENMLTGCLIEISSSTTIETCRRIRADVLYGLRGPSRNRIGTYGNVSVEKTADWVPILIENEPSPESSATTTASKGSCPDMVLGVYYEILYAYTGSAIKPQAKIVGAKMTFLQPRTISVQCIGPYCGPTAANLTQKFPVISSVTFIDISKPPEAISSEIPTFNARIPYDFFYPFSGINIAYSNYPNCLIIMFIIAVIFYMK